MQAGIYKGLSFEEYRGAAAVSCDVILDVLDRCPRAAWHSSYLNPNPSPPENSDRLDVGVIAHSILLEGDESRVEVIDPADYPAARGGAIPNGWTNSNIRAARDAARAAGRVPVLLDRMQEIRAMVVAAREFIATLKETEPAVWKMFQEGGGSAEVSMFWDDPIGGVPCRIRPDLIAPNGNIVIDAKFSALSVEPDSWGRRQLIGQNYYPRAAFYRRGVEQLIGESPAYLFLNVEVEPPYLCSLVGVPPSAFALGLERVERGLRVWAECVERNEWPGYPARTCYPELPAWEVARWEERLGLTESADV